MVAVHIFAVLYAIVIVFVSDEYGLSWILGRKETLSPKKLTWLHRLTWVGLVILIGSGAYLALPQLSYLLGNLLFIMKMLFVVILLLNAHLIGKLTHVATERPFRTLSFDERVPLFISGALSAVSWAGALIMALLVFH